LEILCTSCHRPVRPVVAVDIDGTLADYHFALTRFACRYWNKGIPLRAWKGDGNFEDYLGLTQAEYREAKLAYRQGGYKRMASLQPGALQFMARMATLDCELWIATTRPWSKLDNVDPDTKFWLARHNIVYDHLLFHDEKYRQLAEIVGADRVVAVVEDLPEQLDSAHTYLPEAKALMIARYHNFERRADYDTHMDFGTVFNVIRKEVEEWGSQRTSRAVSA